MSPHRILMTAEGELKLQTVRWPALFGSQREAASQPGDAFQPEPLDENKCSAGDSMCFHLTLPEPLNNHISFHVNRYSTSSDVWYSQTSIYTYTISGYFDTRMAYGGTKLQITTHMLFDQWMFCQVHGFLSDGPYNIPTSRFDCTRKPNRRSHAKSVCHVSDFKCAYHNTCKWPRTVCVHWPPLDDDSSHDVMDDAKCTSIVLLRKSDLYASSFCTAARCFFACESPQPSHQSPSVNTRCQVYDAHGNLYPKPYEALHRTP